MSTALKTRLEALKIVPVVTLERAEDVIPLGRALSDNGLPVAEITFRSPAAAQAIRLLRADQPDMLIAAGTVLTREQVQAAKEAKADFVVAPGFNPSTARACAEAGISFVPGVNNPSAVEAALEHGLTMLKFFPAEASGGIAMLEALSAPYGQISLMPTGGITTKNLRDYLALPCVVACGGSWMVSKTLIADRDWAEIGRLTRLASASLA